MKTAMKELYDKISNLDQAAESSDAWLRLKDFIKSENLLEKEKQQMNNLPIMIHEGIENIHVYIENNIIHVKSKN